MKSVNKYLVVAFAMLVPALLYGQVSSEKLKKEQEKLEQKISDTKLLLNKLTTNAESSLNELRIIENQVNFREELVRNFDNQVRGAQANIVDRQRQIKELNERIVTMKKQYKALVLYAYKNRNKYGKLMYIMSSDNYYEAVNRKKYLDKIAELQQKQFFIILQNQKLIAEEIEAIGRTKEEKLVILNEKKKEKNAILKDKEKKKNVYQDFKTQEKEIRRQLIQDEKERENLKNKIADAIRREIAEAERKKKGKRTS